MMCKRPVLEETL